MLRGDSHRLVRIGKRITAYDGVEAGAYMMRPAVFETLARLLQQTVYCTLADAMQQVADAGRLHYVSTGGLKWYSELTVSNLQQPIGGGSKAVLPHWREDALRMLATSGSGGQLAMLAVCSRTSSDSHLDAEAVGSGGMKRVSTFIQVTAAVIALAMALMIAWATGQRLRQ